MTPKTALITGGTCGIGLEIAKIHAASGGDLVIVARNLTVLKEVKSKLESEINQIDANWIPKVDQTCNSKIESDQNCNTISKM